MKASKNEIGKAIAILTAEYDMPAFADVKIAMWMEELKRFPAGTVQRSAENFIRTSRFKPQLSDIVKGCEVQVPVAWDAADEVWAKMPKSSQKPPLLENGRPDYRSAEAPPAIMCDETTQAMAAAQPLLDMGEETAARMAFKAAYNRLAEKAKLEGRVPKYFVSPGGTFEEQLAVRNEGVRLGLLPAPAIEPTQALLGHNGTKPSLEGRKHLSAMLLTLKPKRFGENGIEGEEP